MQPDAQYTVLLSDSVACRNKPNDTTPTNDQTRISTQIGAVVYTTPGRGDWKGGPNDWFCVVFADPIAVSRVSKAWVPKELWFKRDAVIDRYIKELNRLWVPAKTLRMSIIHGKGWDHVQMVIPPGLLNSSGGGMGIEAWCKKNINDIPNHRAIVSTTTTDKKNLLLVI